MQSRSHFLAASLVAIFSLGLTPIFEKLAVETGNGLPGIVLSMNLITVMLLALPGWRHRPSRLASRWTSLLLVGSLASGLVVFLNLWALETTSATHRSVFQAMYPAATAVFAYKLLGERLPGISYVVIATMTAGVILMSIRGFHWQLVKGDILLLLTLPMMGLCDAWAKAALGTLTPQWVALGRFLFGTLVLLLIFLPGVESITWPTGETWLWVFLSAASISLGINMLYLAMQIEGAALAAAMMSLAPVVTLVMEWYWLGMAFRVIELLGMTLVLMGGFLLTRPAFQSF